MKKQIAQWLVSIARRLDGTRQYELTEVYEPCKLGIGYHLSKRDVKKFRAEHPEYTSHRKGLDGFIEDTKQIILGNIAAGLKEKGLVTYSVKKTLWTADVTGEVVVYKKKDAAKE